MDALVFAGSVLYVFVAWFAVLWVADKWPPSGPDIARGLLWPLSLARNVVTEAYRIVRHG